MIQLAQILFILSVLVILHEFGHYIAAKAFKVRIEKFYLFIDAGFSIVKKKIGETEWGIGWLPLGGYVKLSGMIDESMDTAQMNGEAQPWEFRSKPAWQRLIIMLGGIIVNIILAWAIYTTMFATVGQKYIATDEIQKNGLAFGAVGEKVGFKNGDKIVSVDGEPLQQKFNWLIIDMLLGNTITIDRQGKQLNIELSDEQKGLILGTEGKDFVKPRLGNPIVNEVDTKMSAYKAGLKKGDVITKIDTKNIAFFDEFGDYLKNKKNDSVTLFVNRNGEDISIKTKVSSSGKIGFTPKIKDKLDFEIIKHHTLSTAIPAAVKESWQLFVYNIKQFKLILKPKTGAYKQIKSPVGIARQLPETWDWEFVWNFTALFSIGLAFMNLLPIPGLDGGHALFTIAEMVTGKKLSDKAMGYVQTAGMIILLTLMAFTFGKDIYQWVMDIITKK
jgi:regulator of sigma E protease